MDSAHPSTTAVAERRINPRTGNGRVGNFVKGVSGNPNGRPKKVPTAQELFEQKVRRDLKTAAKDYAPEALQTVLDIMRNVEVAPQYRLQAASTVLDRGYGKPLVQTEISVGVYEKLSDAELIKFITGQVDGSSSMVDVTPEQTQQEDRQSDIVDETDVQDQTESIEE